MQESEYEPHDGTSTDAADKSEISFYPKKPTGEPSDEEITEFLNFVTNFRDNDVVLTNNERVKVDNVSVFWKYKDSNIRGALPNVVFITLNLTDRVLIIETLVPGGDETELHGVSAVNLEELSLSKGL